MGTGEQATPARPSKTSSTNQETPATPSYPDWSSSMQAYYGPGAPPPFFASTVATPSPHPYLWGNQHPLMPPYGTPIPYPALYPPAGVYAHPNMAMAPGPLQAVESDAKAPEGKDRTTNKKSKGANKAGDTGKAASGSGNDGATQSAESGSEGSSDESDENNNHEQSASKKGSFDQMLADGATAQNNSTVGNFQASVPGNPVVSVPVANLNIGMDLWNPSSAASGTMKMHPSPGVSPGVASGMMGDQWIPDERELKRQKRKQSNRESARRSRLRKQAECEELQQRVESLNGENRSLKEELQRLSEECEKLTSENNSIKEEFTRLCGPEAMSKLESESIAHLQPHGEENDS